MFLQFYTHGFSSQFRAHLKYHLSKSPHEHPIRCNSLHTSVPSYHLALILCREPVTICFLFLYVCLQHKIGRVSILESSHIKHSINVYLKNYCCRKSLSMGRWQDEEKTNAFSILEKSYYFYENMSCTSILPKYTLDKSLWLKR